MARDHQIFVRPDHPGGCFAVAFCNPRAACGICRRVDFQPEPARRLADPTANFRSVLADARGENEGINSDSTAIMAPIPDLRRWM